MLCAFCTYTRETVLFFLALIHLTFWQVRDGGQHRLRPSASNFGSRLFLPVRIALATALWPRARSPPFARIGVREPEREHRLYYIVHHHIHRIQPEEYIIIS
uniref:Uncharacterized protein n=1 Tax=Schizaphis graminum TaxID=13262 RepID=A0A2S2P8R3_SCHGA